MIKLLTKATYFIRRRLKGECQILRGGSCVIRRSVRIRTRLTLEDDVSILENCSITGGPVFIGRGTNIRPDSRIGGPIKIGRYCAIARQSIFLSRNHPMNWAGIQMRFYRQILGVPLNGVSKGGSELGNDVWVGTRVIFTPGVHVGDGAVIGAGSVVTKDVPPYSVTAGNPAKHITYRFSQEIIEVLLSLKWWDWSVGRIKRNKKFFTTDLNSIDADSLKSIVVD